MGEAPLDEALVSQILEQATELAGLADSARAEAWASGVLGLWREPGAGVDLVAADAQLLAALGDAGTPAALALLTALSAILDPRLRDEATTLTAELGEQGMPAPHWAPAVGSSEPGRAWWVADPDDLSRTAVFEFVAADGAHSMLIEFEGPVVRDVLFGPAPDELFSGLMEPGAEPLEPEEADARQLAASVAAGWRMAVQEGAAPTEGWTMNGCAALARLERLGDVADIWSLRWPGGELAVTPEPSKADREADEAALEVLRSALGDLGGAPPVEIEMVANRLRGRIESGQWPAAALLASEAFAADAGGTELLVGAASAYVARRRLEMPPDEAEAVAALEWADWLGAVIQLVRAGELATVTPAALVDNINRCPEVSTSIPKRDREYFERAFALVIEAWRFCGFVDDANHPTTVGLWAIPRGLQRAWSNQQ